jgi:hypothetical protein
LAILYWSMTRQIASAILSSAQRLFGAMNGWRVEAVDNKATARMSIPLYVAAAAGTL